MTHGLARTGHELPPHRGRQLAQGLGWFSIGLGLAEILAPHALTRALGMRGAEPLVQAYGVREIVTGIGILGSDQPRPWLVGRLAGDGLDVATLATAYHDDNPRRGSVGLALAMVAGVAVLDFLATEALGRDERRGAAAVSDWRRRMLAAYSRRSGLPRGVQASRGAARDFEVPRDFRAPEAMRPWRDGKPANDAVAAPGTTATSKPSAVAAGAA
ncbi:cyclase dehydrase [Antarcticirhabdus aurantiaca]|uniref:Cyclase dehydrase n=1 Tax=Antarcticirhabdus aurantiaca TaxID=2606717 RepID=A0ACD4NT93_9HYPH|nr:cyclase dehydrase [Antarcticirhabdus aurantiaca]WAJ30235.1 cyclase dehydrase [Jeongeuplla avenae]